MGNANREHDMGLAWARLRFWDGRAQPIPRLSLASAVDSVVSHSVYHFGPRQLVLAVGCLFAPTADIVDFAICDCDNFLFHCYDL